MVQGNESTLTGDTIAKSRIIGIPDELCPVTVDDPSPCLKERIFNGIEEDRVGVEIRKSHGFQFEALAAEVGVNELFDCASGKGGSVDGSKICEDLTGGFVGWFIDERL